MKHTKKRFLNISVATMLLFASAINVFAASNTFSSVKVDSNEWSYVSNAVKETTYGEIETRITAIYKANGDASNYKQIKGRFTSGGNCCTTSNSYSVKLKENLFCDLKDSYKKVGKAITFWGMGRDASLDCKVSGKFIVD